MRSKLPRFPVLLALLLAALLPLATGCASTQTERQRGARAYPGTAPEVGQGSGEDSIDVEEDLGEAQAEASEGAASRPDGAVESYPGEGTPELAAEAAEFVDRAEADLMRLLIDAERAAWVQSTYITHDTEILAAQANEKLLAASVRYAQEAARYDGVELPYDVRRKLDLLKTSMVLPAPAEPAKTEELTRIMTRLESRYGKGEYCPGGEGQDCLDLLELSRIIGSSRDAAELEDAWVGWRTISPPMRDDYTRMVDLANQGARELGYDDVGVLWRVKYDMPPDAFAAELDRLWQQVEPLYTALHCHVRARLREHYGAGVVPADGPIPAHLLGNMWAQDWLNVYPLVAPADGDPGYDLTALLEEQGLDAREMVRVGERFFSSLGFAPLPDTFWERSLFTQPADRSVVCHASAWDVDQVNDLRIKMCIQVNAEDFQTIHHELGHNYYQRAYNEKPFLYRGSANDGFHEAVGDTIALSVTPPYLVDLGYLDEEPPPSKDIGLLLKDALNKVAFLPFALVIDSWRWDVFSGEIGPDDYNAGWWDLRQSYQGVAPPVPRSEADFDPGAKYHIPANTPYMRYFLAHILQFQFHKALCDAAGYEGPLNRCTIFGSEEAGDRLNAMLEMGLSRPWPEALEVLTGSERMDATPILEYFAPLRDWLEEQNSGRQCGW